MASRIFAKVYFAIGIISVLILSGCPSGFETSEDGLPKTSDVPANPWSQATAPPSTQSEQSSPASGGTGASCSIYVPAVMAQDQELRVVVMSRGLAQFQVSANGSGFINLPATNGALTWAANIFDAGSYNLKFRGQLENNSYVDCDPANKTLTIYASTSSPLPPSPTPTPSPAPTPSPTPAPSPSPENGGTTVDRNYAALVGTNGAFKGYKDVYNPSILPKLDVDPSFSPGEKCYQLSTRHWPEVLRTHSATKYRIFIPPGTKNFYMTALTYYDSSTVQSLAMKLNSAPTSSYEIALGNHPTDSLGRNALENLFAGNELTGYVGLNANIMPGFPGKGTGTDYSVRYSYKTPKGGWLYVNHLRIIGGVSLLMTTNICVDIADYENWYRNAQWDSEGNPL